MPPSRTVRRVRIAIVRGRTLTPPTPPTEPTLRCLSPAEVCDRLSVSRATLRNWENDGILIPARVGKIIMYDLRDVETFVRDRVLANATDLRGGR